MTVSIGAGWTIGEGWVVGSTPDLVLSLDAGNTSSYPGSGSTWTDLAGGKTFTLNGSPTYSSSNGGYLNFVPASGQWANSSNEFYLDTKSNASNAVEKTNSLMYGTFNSTISSQTLTTNSQFTATYGVTVSTAGYGLTVKA